MNLEKVALYSALTIGSLVAAFSLATNDWSHWPRPAEPKQQVSSIPSTPPTELEILQGAAVSSAIGPAVAAPF